MTLVEIDDIEDNGGEFALKEGDFLVVLTGPNAGETMGGDAGDMLPNFTEMNKTLREIFGEENSLL